jgi:hypothetical protein
MTGGSPRRLLLGASFLCAAACLACLALPSWADDGPANAAEIPRTAFGPLRAPGREERTLYLNRPWNSGPLCGPNALYLLAQLEGHTVSLDELYGLVPVDQEAGCTLADLVQAAGAVGFPAEARRVSDRELSELPPPYLLHLAAAEEQPELGHFVVVFEYRPSDGKFGIIDPGTGEFSYTSSRGLLRSYSGYVLAPRRGLPRFLVVANVALICAGCAYSVREVLRPKTPCAGREDATHDSPRSDV